ncbi:MAG: hypothetical protein HY430_00060 [Candidatus Levybacteria bacterium]|nr:hypothetical protein [Candidatus Levybacteria bacterium]
MKRVATFSAVFLTGVMVTTSLAFAITTTPSPTGTIKEKVKAQACARATKKIERIITQSESRLTKRQNYVTKRKAKIDEQVSKLKAKGADTTALEEAATQLKTLLDTWISDYRAFIDDLEETKDFTCGDSQGNFKKALDEARAKRKVVKQSGDAVRKYYRDSYRPAFQAARKALLTKLQEARKEELKKRLEERKKQIQERIDKAKERAQNRKEGATKTPTPTVAPTATQ